MEARNHLGTHRVHDVTHHRYRCNETDNLVEKAKGVARNVIACEDILGFIEHHIIATFGKSQKECEEKRHE